jgi:hypothetical protein
MQTSPRISYVTVSVNGILAVHRAPYHVEAYQQAGQATAGPTFTTPESGIQPEQCTPFFHSVSGQGQTD